MNIFEKIKQIFRNFGKKQKLIEAPKEKLAEMGDLENIERSTTTVESPEQTTFRDELRFDPKDLLDPRVCQGDDVIPNILKTLGVNEAILQNPVMMIRIRSACKQIIEQSDFRLPKGDKPLERKDIEAIVDMFKSSVALTDSAARKDKLNEIGIGSKGEPVSFIGMTIDSETGNLTISSDTLPRETSEKHLYTVHEFSTDDKGNTVQTSQSAILNPNGTSDLNRTEDSITFNEDGIEMQHERRSYAEGLLTSHNIVTRDSENPFITQTQFLVQEGVSCEEVKYTVQGVDSRYSSRNPNSITSLPQAPLFPTSGKKVFDDRKKSVAYYENQKQQIFDSIYEIRAFNTFSKLYTGKEKQTLNNGLKKLAQKAGILPKEQEAEKSE